LILGWLWIETESIWIVALAHGALNAWGQYAFKFMTGPGQLRDALVLTTGGIALTAVGAVLVTRSNPARFA
jgi:membrane protease YdiL (CAAX protease family)